MRAVERHLKALLGHRFSRKALTSESHLEWVRGLSCAVTGRPWPEAHHVQLKAQGRNDFTAIPLTAEAHRCRHDQSSKTFEQVYNAEEKDILIAVLIAKIIDLEGKA